MEGIGGNSECRQIVPSLMDSPMPMGLVPLNPLVVSTGHWTAGRTDYIKSSPDEKTHCSVSAGNTSPPIVPCLIFYSARQGKGQQKEGERHGNHRKHGRYEQGNHRKALQRADDAPDERGQQEAALLRAAVHPGCGMRPSSFLREEADSIILESSVRMASIERAISARCREWARV